MRARRCTASRTDSSSGCSASHERASDMALDVWCGVAADVRAWRRSLRSMRAVLPRVSALATYPSPSSHQRHTSTRLSDDRAGTAPVSDPSPSGRSASPDRGGSGPRGGPRGPRHQDAPGFSVGLETAREVHRVATQVVRELPLPDHAGHRRPRREANPRSDGFAPDPQSTHIATARPKAMRIGVRTCSKKSARNARSRSRSRNLSVMGSMVGRSAGPFTPCRCCHR